VLGLILEAGCRDVSELTKMQFPVWSKAVFAQGTVKETVGNVNMPVVCAGQLINPGDLIVADDDGVVVVRRKEAADVLRMSREREEKEAKSRQRYLKGELSLDVNNMRAKLAERGLKYLDHPPED
jgi:4-hydroxy-4-methyl-2-oxoglutarate aldolase